MLSPVWQRNGCVLHWQERPMRKPTAAPCRHLPNPFQRAGATLKTPFCRWFPVMPFALSEVSKNDFLLTTTFVSGYCGGRWCEPLGSLPSQISLCGWNGSQADLDRVFAHGVSGELLLANRFRHLIHVG